MSYVDLMVCKVTNAFIDEFRFVRFSQQLLITSSNGYLFALNSNACMWGSQWKPNRTFIFEPLVADLQGANGSTNTGKRAKMDVDWLLGSLLDESCSYTWTFAWCLQKLIIRRRDGQTSEFIPCMASNTCGLCLVRPLERFSQLKTFVTKTIEFFVQI